jgi:hypothetical protein
MNLFGKIFTLLIFFLSITFLVLAVMVGASHRNWKEIATKNAELARSAETRLSAAQSASDDAAKKLNAEQVARQQQLSQLFAENQLAQTALDNAVRENRVVTEQNARLAAELNVSNTRLVDQDKQVEDLKNRNKSLIDDIAAQRATVVAMTNEQYRLQADLDEKTQMSSSLAGQLATKIRIMKANGLTDQSLTADIPRQVEGVVTRYEDGFIAISLGTDDGLREDHNIDIYRGKRYVGRAVVTTTEHNKSAARLLDEFTQTVVREGDYVTTKF